MCYAISWTLTHDSVSGVNTSDNLRSTSSTIHRALSKYTDSDSSGPIYTSVSQESFSNLNLLVYARPHVTNSVKKTSTSTVGFGIGGVMSNKGALATRVEMNDGDVCTFVNAHLAAHDAFLERRNQGVLGVLYV